jgi:hypothetical protein
VIAREKQRKQLGGVAIADGETDAKNASVDDPLGLGLSLDVLRYSFLGMHFLPNDIIFERLGFEPLFPFGR